jgi:putative FmdB family regulatory protein
MPVYEYEALDSSKTCPHCIGTFEIIAKMSEPDASHCPHCGAAIARVISATRSISGQAHLLKEKHFAERGFTQYKRAGGGVYEKTAGDGPKFIADDGKPIKPVGFP